MTLSPPVAPGWDVLDSLEQELRRYHGQLGKWGQESKCSGDRACGLSCWEAGQGRLGWCLLL